LAVTVLTQNSNAVIFWWFVSYIMHHKHLNFFGMGYLDAWMFPVARVLSAPLNLKRNSIYENVNISPYF
jgi:hypothetical protein